MSKLFSLKHEALLPEIELTLTPVGYIYDLAGTTVEFRYRKKGDGVVEVITCTITDAAAKKVRLTPVSALVDTIGKFDCHVRVTIGVKYLYFPNTGFDSFEITENF